MSPLTVAVTGPTGTLGRALVPQLQRDPAVERVVGLARRPFDPAAEGWTKMEYRRGDVRDADGLARAFTGADVVVHLASVITGGPRDTTREVNVEGALHAFRAAAAAGARRFVQASSVAAYGFHRDNPVGMREDWPVRPAERLFYARDKAHIEEDLTREAARAPGTALYLVRPSLVVGPHVVGAKELLPAPFAEVAGPVGRAVVALLRALPFPLPVLAPGLRLQVVHEDDVATLILACVKGDGPPGAYNVAADGVLTVGDLLREAGLLPVPVPSFPLEALARVATRLPYLPGRAGWVEAAAHPAVMDTGRAKELLGWRPRFTAIDAVRDTVAYYRLLHESPERSPAVGPEVPRS